MSVNLPTRFNGLMRLMVIISALVIGVVLVSLANRSVLEADSGDSFYFQPKWTHIVARQGDLIENTLNIQNRGDSTVFFTIELAKIPGSDWDIEIRGATAKYQVRGVVMPPGDLKSLPVEFRVPYVAPPGDYDMLVKATSIDGSFEAEAPMKVTVLIDERRLAFLELSGQVELQAPEYTSLTGTQDSDFEFGVVVRNRTKDAVELDLSALAPAGWTVGFVPSFNPDKQIASVTVEAGASESITVQARPSANADPGRYGIQFTAIGEETQLSTGFEIQLTGFTQLQMGVPSGGRPIETNGESATPATVIVTNTGNLPVGKISLESETPVGWQVSFEPPQLLVLKRDEVREVIAQIQPNANVLAGDYRVTLQVAAEGTVDSVDLFITVNRGSIWGWIGVVIAVLAAGGLSWLIVTLGRR